jgi:hypothetical protein
MSDAPAGISLQQVGDQSIREEEGIWGDIIGPDNRTVVARVKVVGTYSKRYRKALEAQVARRRRRTKLTPDEYTAQHIAVMAECILEWEGFKNGEAVVPCTPATAIPYLTQAPWLREQVDELMQDHEGFSMSNSTA